MLFCYGLCCQSMIVYMYVYFHMRELCDIRDGVKQCDYFDNDEISILLTSLCTD